MVFGSSTHFQPPRMGASLCVPLSNGLLSQLSTRLFMKLSLPRMTTFPSALLA